MAERIKQNHLFRMVYSRGKSFASPLLVTYVVPRRSGGIQLGITSGKKIGNAVIRNRARRVVRAAWRACEKELNPDCSAFIVFVARTRTAPAKSTDVAKAMLQHLKDAGVARS